MTNSYQPSKNNQRRVFKTPLIVPLSVVMVVGIYAGYVFLYATGTDAGAFATLTTISFEVFLLCEVAMISIIAYNKRQLDQFLWECPEIESRRALEKLKPIVRTNMYSSLFMIFFLALGSLTAIMSILNNGLWKGVLVALLSVTTAKLINWYNPSEEKAKQIECSDETLELELNEILECWLSKPLPRF